MDIFRKKHISAASKMEMKRHLKLVDLVFLGVGSMVGTGIFTITGIGAARYAGPALILSIVIAAVAVSISALFFAEFASRFHINGGAYGYLYLILGEFPAWITGWLTIMGCLTAISGVASGWGGYLKGFLRGHGLELPVALNGTFNPDAGHMIDLFPVLVLVLVTGMVLLNAKSVLRFNSALVLLKCSALALFILLGIMFVKPENWSPFLPFGFGQIYGGRTGVMAGASLMFFAFLGFESISMSADEVKDPQKMIPRGIAVSLLMVTILYILVASVLTGVVRYSWLGVPDAVSFALRSVGLFWAADYISVVAILTLITVCIAMTYALSRIIYSISQDGLLPEKFSHLTNRSKVPKNATILVGFLSAICSSIFPLSSIAEFLNVCTLSYLILVAYGIIELRKDYGSPQTGEFRTPWVPFLPILSIVICLSLMSQYKLVTWLAFGIALLLGVLLYFFYGHRHSRLAVHKN